MNCCLYAIRYVSIQGYTSQKSPSKRLAIQRANRVHAALVELGISPDLVRVYTHDSDLRSQGKLLRNKNIPKYAHVGFDPVVDSSCE